MPTLAQLYRYPVKGLSAEPLAAAELSPGQAIPHDRQYAIAHGASRFDPNHPGWQDKRQFLTLMTHERLAELQITFDDTTNELDVQRNGRHVVRGVISTRLGRDLVNQFLAGFMRDRAPPPPRLVEAPGTPLSDSRVPYLSLINLASLTDLERVTRAPVDPLRFRGNLYIADADPWVEEGWIGRDLAIGTARLRVMEPIPRCAATAVNPTTAMRDINIPKALVSGYGHSECGVFAEVITAGRIAPGDTIALL